MIPWNKIYFNIFIFQHKYSISKFYEIKYNCYPGSQFNFSTSAFRNSFVELFQLKTRMFLLMTTVTIIAQLYMILGNIACLHVICISCNNDLISPFILIFAQCHFVKDSQVINYFTLLTSFWEPFFCERKIYLKSKLISFKFQMLKQFNGYGNNSS